MSETQPTENSAIRTEVIVEQKNNPLSGFETIKSRFAPWLNIPMWVLSNKEKAPIKEDGSLLLWKQAPGDGINTLSVIQSRFKDGYGFGLILGLNNTLVCYDFDHALNDEGNIINPDVKGLIEILGSFVEISSSGKGLHLFVNAELTEGVVLTEYGFKTTFSEGKFYPARFIKLTGNCLNGYDLPVKTLNKHEFDTIRRKISNEVIPSTFVKALTPGKSFEKGDNWGELLTEVGILHTSSQYYGKTRTYSDGKSKTATESYRIPCPNRKNHTGIEKRKDRFGPDAAILTKWSDGTSSCTCNHNSCDPATNPNLLKMLWTEIRALRVEDARAILAQYKDVLA